MTQYVRYTTTIADCGCCVTLPSGPCACFRVIANFYKAADGCDPLYGTTFTHPPSAIRTLYATVTKWMIDDCLCHTNDGFYPGGVRKQGKWPLAVGTILEFDLLPVTLPGGAPTNVFIYQCNRVSLGGGLFSTVANAPDDTGGTFNDLVFWLFPCGQHVAIDISEGFCPAPNQPEDPTKPDGMVIANQTTQTLSGSTFTSVISITSCDPFTATFTMTADCGDTYAPGANDITMDITE